MKFEFDSKVKRKKARVGRILVQELALGSAQNA